MTLRPSDSNRTDLKEKTRNNFGLPHLGILLIAIGALANQWVLGPLFARDGAVDSMFSKVFIWIFDLIFVLAGIMFLMKPSLRKKCLLSLAMIAIVIIGTEVGLHAVNVAIRAQYPEGRMPDPRIRLSPFQDKSWAAEMLAEWSEVAMDFEPYVNWRSREYHGQFINVDDRGFRKTWEAGQDLAKQSDRKSIFMFGGSTTWGTGARDEYTIPSFVAKILESKNFPVRVVNYAEGGYSFTQALIRLVLALRDGNRPDCAIFYDGINDVYGAFLHQRPGALFYEDRMIKKFAAKELDDWEHLKRGMTGLFTSHCMLYQRMVRLFELMNPKRDIRSEASIPERTFTAADATAENRGSDAVDAGGMGPQAGGRAMRGPLTDGELRDLSTGVAEYYLKSYELLDRLSRIYKFRYLCLWQPVIFTEKFLTAEEANMMGPEFRDIPRAKVHRYALEALRAARLPHFYDLSDVLEGRTETHYIDDWHLSEQGNEVVARKIVEYFEKEFLSDVED